MIKLKENTEGPPSDEAMIEIIEMHKWFGDFHVLQGINLTDLYKNLTFRLLHEGVYGF